MHDRRAAKGKDEETGDDGCHCFDNTFMVNPKEVRAKCVLSSFISYEILIVSMESFLDLC